MSASPQYSQKLSLRIIRIDLPDIPSIVALHSMDNLNLHNTPGALESLHADIFELTNSVFARMREGAAWPLR